MKHETAKALAWPWETERCFVNNRNEKEYYSAFSSFSAKWIRQFVVFCPSVEEMLERMPARVILYKDPWMKYRVEIENIDRFCFADEPSEALALLCIWLRDNDLMKWG